MCFGVAPALILYLWGMNHGGRFGWAIVLLYSVCAALRLARFNTALDDASRPAWTFNYFTGVPAPAGAGTVLLPLVASFETGPGWLDRPLAGRRLDHPDRRPDGQPHPDLRLPSACACRIGWCCRSCWPSAPSPPASPPSPGSP
ncbi:MAG: hypothetical protein WDO24_02320 [Pseudomonadota bacterium]